MNETANSSPEALRQTFRRERARELTSRRRARARETHTRDNLHESVSNRMVVTETMAFEPATGSLEAGRSAGLEAIAERRRTGAPETAPAPVTPGQPLDAYWASFGTSLDRARARADDFTIERIIGTDDRVQVTANENYPWRSICSLLLTAQDGTNWIGTGWLVSPRLVLTAGHCVYMHDEGGWASQIEVIPGRDGSERPFGSVIARDYRSVRGWTESRDRDYDYGAILLPPERRYGDELGWFGFTARDDDHLEGITLNLSGYPGDKPGTQWFHSRTVKDVDERQITYEIDTMGGQSGAPVWEYTADGSRYGVAIHTWGTSVSNGATRITREVFDNIVAWVGLVP